MMENPRQPVPWSRWLFSALTFSEQKSKADLVEDTSGAFFVGVGDRFDDDRRRIHIAE